MLEKFTKDMLVSGEHVVEYRNGKRKLYLNGGFMGLYSGTSLMLYRDDLTEIINSSEDIVKVFLVDVTYNSIKDILDYPGILVWQRKERVTISKYEALRKLKEVYGEEVSVEW